MRITAAPGYLPGPLQHVGTTAGLYSATPVAQGTATANLTDNVGGTPGDTLNAIPDPANTPITADMLRDDLVDNALPAIRTDVSSLRAKVNAALTWIRNIGGIAP